MASCKSSIRSSWTKTCEFTGWRWNGSCSATSPCAIRRWNYRLAASTARETGAAATSARGSQRPRMMKASKERPGPRVWANSGIGDLLPLDACPLRRHLLQAGHVRGAKDPGNLHLRLVVILPSAGLEAYMVDHVPVKVISRTGKVDDQCPLWRRLKTELQVRLAGGECCKIPAASGRARRGFAGSFAGL